ncbi:hypothetical protein BHE74_00001422 [Ensete ventricosum]|nr:hypothetical protein GW17_00022714 [Ensete ventricosum]RWW89581.1 hypothetical protein BHE74_00001422 [Ensete ventricosum]RZR78020.1 hypothetical protein BHM03_00003241 [Ensete ventricosum]
MSNRPSISQIVLAVGTKLHVIVARMAVKLDREKIVITGAPPVQPNDDFFWFGVVVQFLCSYITLPMYALVTQMGSEFKRSMFGERTTTMLRRWHEEVRTKRKKQHPHRSPPSTVSHQQQEILMQIASST